MPLFAEEIICNCSDCGIHDSLAPIEHDVVDADLQDRPRPGLSVSELLEHDKSILDWMRWHWGR